MFKKQYQKICVFDLETTGLNHKTDEIIEFGCILLENQNGTYKLTKEVSELVKVPFKLPQKIIELTHITDEMLKRDGILKQDLFQLVDSLIDQDTLLIAYNIQFDLSFLGQLFKTYKGENYVLTNDILDVFAIFKDRHDYPHKLVHAIEAYKIDEVNSHRSLDDVKATYKVLIHMMNEHNNIELYINNIGFHPRYGLTGPRLPHINYYPHEFIKGDLINKIIRKSKEQIVNF